MDVRTRIEERFLKINKTLGLITGVWPYQNSNGKLIGQVVCLSLMFSAFVTQTAKLLLFFDWNLLVSSMPYYVAMMGTFVKLGNYITDESKVSQGKRAVLKYLFHLTQEESKLIYSVTTMASLTNIFEQNLCPDDSAMRLNAVKQLQLKSILDGVFEDWMAIKSREEHDTMVKYSQRGTLVTIAYTLHIFVVLIFLACLPFIPPLLDIIHPLNHTRKRLLIYPAYYWLDYEEYYVLITAHMLLNMLTLAFIFCACDTNYVYAVQHSCGLLAITRLRFRNACKLQNGERLPNRKAYKNVCESIKQHQRAIKYLKQIEETHHTYLFISMGMLTLAISVSLLKIAADTIHEAEWMIQLLFLFTQLFHLLFLTVQGQFIINELNDVYNAIYASTWYNSAPETQSLYVLALRSSLNPPLLTAGGLVTLNLRSFAEIVKASVSYYTVMQT